MKPAYILIMDYIKAKILSKELRPGDKVPSENELARMFNVSRLTARKALENLEYEGIVTRIQGLGTFVASVHEQLKGVRIGVLITNYQDTRASMLFGIVRTFQKFSIDVIPFNLDALFTNTIHEERMLRELLKLEIKGLIIEPRISSLSDTLLLGLINENFPVVFVDRIIEGFPKVPVVYSDNRNGGQIVGKHMKKHHVKSALFVTEEPFDVSSVKERFDGLKDEVTEITWKMITDFDKDFHSAVKTVQREGLEAVFFCNDYLAIRGITYLKEYGYKIPADISVYGFDDLRVSLYAYPRLTTVHQDFQAMGELAALQLVKIFLGEPLEFEERVPVSLIVRESCGCNKL
ncbi:GntR family transcriptional regulator [Pseudothermotoga sp. U03pept]|uniref:GntR family transcriptional regulator n=1 Tax=Pseudothermotoga sp. U03pept TaxID=3447012 RepID=UPI003F0BF344